MTSWKTCHFSSQPTRGVNNRCQFICVRYLPNATLLLVIRVGFCTGLGQAKFQSGISGPTFCTGLGRVRFLILLGRGGFCIWFDRVEVKSWWGRVRF